MPIPIYTHDCDECTFVGHIYGFETWSTHRVSTHDAYICVNRENPDMSSVIFRSGNDGPEYQSMPLFCVRRVVDRDDWKEYPIVSVYYLALSRGIIDR